MEHDRTERRAGCADAFRDPFREPLHRKQKGEHDVKYKEDPDPRRLSGAARRCRRRRDPSKMVCSEGRANGTHRSGKRGRAGQRHGMQSAEPHSG